MRAADDFLQPSATLADLAVRFAGASRAFHRHGLDFCCGGQVPLEEACRRNGLDAEQLVSEIREIDEAGRREPNMAEAPPAELIPHLLEQFHAPHREELPRLLEMARKVESVHADKPECPHGLGDHLQAMSEELELHMQKEEQVLFPLILAGRGRMAGAPIACMEDEHQDAGRSLRRLRELAHDFSAPENACNTWCALYLGLEEFERDLMEHIHLENNALFPRALNG